MGKGDHHDTTCVVGTAGRTSGRRTDNAWNFSPTREEVERDREIASEYAVDVLEWIRDRCERFVAWDEGVVQQLVRQYEQCLRWFDADQEGPPPYAFDALEAVDAEHDPSLPLRTRPGEESEPLRWVMTQARASRPAEVDRGDRRRGGRRPGGTRKEPERRVRRDPGLRDVAIGAGRSR